MCTQFVCGAINVHHGADLPCTWKAEDNAQVHHFATSHGGGEGLTACACCLRSFLPFLFHVCLYASVLSVPCVCVCSVIHIVCACVSILCMYICQYVFYFSIMCSYCIRQVCVYFFIMSTKLRAWMNLWTSVRVSIVVFYLVSKTKLKLWS